MTICEHCPLRSEGVACPAVTRPHPRFCQLMDPAHPDFDPSHERPIRMLAGLVVDRAAAPAAATAPPPIPLAGDLVEAAAKRFGADRLANWIAAKLGAHDCRCESRRNALNKLDASLRAYLGLGR